MKKILTLDEIQAIFRNRGTWLTGETVRAIESAILAKLDLDDIRPSEAVTAFAAWLTTRKMPVTFGASHDVAEVALLVREFNKSQAFREVRSNYTNYVRPYPNGSAGEIDGEKCPECDRGTKGLSGSPKWCCYCGAKLSGNSWHPKVEAVVKAWGLLDEAHKHGQFADDLERPLAKPIRGAIRTILDSVSASSETHITTEDYTETGKAVFESILGGIFRAPPKVREDGGAGDWNEDGRV